MKQISKLATKFESDSRAKRLVLRWDIGRSPVVCALFRTNEQLEARRAINASYLQSYLCRSIIYEPCAREGHVEQPPPRTGTFPVGRYTISRADEQQHAAPEFISASCILSRRNQVFRRAPLAAPLVAAQHPHDFHFSLSSRARGGPRSYGEPFIRVICHADPAPLPVCCQCLLSTPEEHRYLRRAGVISSPWLALFLRRSRRGSQSIDWFELINKSGASAN